jgi:ABC-2 type transport system permease protein
MRTVGNLLVKEMKELLTPQMLVPFVAMMVLFLGVSRAIRSERARTGGPQTVIVADRDQSDASRAIVAAFREAKVNVVEMQGAVDEALAQAQAAEIAWVIVIPESAGAKLAGLQPVELAAYNIVRGFSIVQAMKNLEVKQLVARVNERLAQAHVARAYAGVDPKQLMQPVSLRQFIHFKGRVAEGTSDTLMALVMSQTFFVPIILLMILIYASQMIAASIGQEKENKTLETLLTTPISRVSIVFGKMLGAALVALAVAGLFMVAML